jgi:hypothetical protein
MQAPKVAKMGLLLGKTQLKKDLSISQQKNKSSP